jgi:FkbM family methyltransferase
VNNLDAVDFEPDAILDVGGNVGEFAELARRRWPDALITSFEPIPELAKANRKQANGRWVVERVALSSSRGSATLHRCINQHSASTMQPPGTLRREAFGIVDRFEPLEVRTAMLDDYADRRRLRTLVKIDVEGHEGSVLVGAGETLKLASGVIIEVQQDSTIVAGAWAPYMVDGYLKQHGLRFAGILDALREPRGRIVQFDGLWRNYHRA